MSEIVQPRKQGSMPEPARAQRCKYCGRLVQGTVVAIMGFGSGEAGQPEQPFAYRFDCPGPHERDDQGTVWLSAEPGPARRARPRR